MNCNMFLNLHQDDWLKQFYMAQETVKLMEPNQTDSLRRLCKKKKKRRNIKTYTA